MTENESKDLPLAPIVRTLRWGVWRSDHAEGVTATCWSCGRYHVALYGDSGGRADIYGRVFSERDYWLLLNGICPVCEGAYAESAIADRERGARLSASRTMTMRESTEVLFVGCGAVNLAETEGVFMPLLGSGELDRLRQVWPDEVPRTLPGYVVCRTLAGKEI
jgi:hypothetical protein